MQPLSSCVWLNWIEVSLATWLHLSKELHYECTTLHATPFTAFSTLIVFFGVIWSAQKKSRVVWFSLSSPFILVGSIFCFFSRAPSLKSAFFFMMQVGLKHSFYYPFFQFDSVWYLVKAVHRNQLLACPRIFSRAPSLKLAFFFMMQVGLKHSFYYHFFNLIVFGQGLIFNRKNDSVWYLAMASLRRWLFWWFSHTKFALQVSLGFSLPRLKLENASFSLFNEKPWSHKLICMSVS